MTKNVAGGKPLGTLGKTVCLVMLDKPIRKVFSACLIMDWSPYLIKPFAFRTGCCAGRAVLSSLVARLECCELFGVV